MIQRKQSLFLLIVFIIGIVMVFVPFQSFDLSSQTSSLCLMPDCNSEIISTAIYFPMTLNYLVIIISLFAILKFKNRVLQYKLANILVLLNVFVTGLFFLLEFYTASVQNIHFTIGAFLPIISAAFAFLAAHFIKKDEQLVRSVDRIR